MTMNSMTPTAPPQVKSSQGHPTLLARRGNKLGRGIGYLLAGW